MDDCEDNIGLAMLAISKEEHAGRHGCLVVVVLQEQGLAIRYTRHTPTEMAAFQGVTWQCRGDPE